MKAESIKTTGFPDRQSLAWKCTSVILAALTFAGVWPDQVLVRFGVESVANILLVFWAISLAQKIEPAGPAALTRRSILVLLLWLLWVASSGLLLGVIGLLRFEAWYGLAFVWVALNLRGVPDKISFPQMTKVSISEVFGRAGIAVVITLILFLAVRYGSASADDISGYHLPFAIEFLQNAKIGSVNRPMNDFMNYPPNGFLVDAWIISAARTDSAVGLLGLPFWPALILVVYALAVELGQDSETAKPLTAIALFIPFAVRQAATPYSDILTTFAWATALLYLYRWNRTDRRVYILVSAAAAGFAWGCKPWGFLYVGILLPVFLFFILQKWNQKALTLEQALSLTLVSVSVLFLLGGAWHLRTWIVFGNPFYPVEFTLGSHVLFPGPVKNPGYTLASEPGFLFRYYGQLVHEFGPWMTIICPLAFLVFIPTTATNPRIAAYRACRWITVMLIAGCLGILFYMPNMRANFPWDFRRVVPLWVLLMVCGACLPIARGFAKYIWFTVFFAAVILASRFSHYWPTVVLFIPLTYLFAVVLRRHQRFQMPKLAVGVVATLLLAGTLRTYDFLREKWRFTEGLGYANWPGQQWIFENVRNSEVQSVGEWRTHLMYGRGFTNRVVYMPQGSVLSTSAPAWFEMLYKQHVDFVFIDNWRRYNKGLAAGQLYAQNPEMTPHPEFRWAEAQPEVFREVQTYSEMVPNWLPTTERKSKVVQAVFQVNQVKLEELIRNDVAQH